MNIETQRRNIVHRILDTPNSKLLKKIEDLLDNESYTFTTSGKSFSKNQYKQHVSEILMVSDLAETGYTTNEAKSKIIRK